MSSNVEQIKDKLDIVDVLSSYIKVEKSGINFKARCPFHNEKTPSFFISPSRQSFYCFGCGEKGDIFSFVEKFEGLDFKGALETLADRAGVELKNIKKEQRSDEKDRLFEIMEAATKFFEETLTKDQTSIDYLNKRGLSKESINKWRLGFAQDEWRSLYDHLLKNGFTKEEMLAAGLIKKVDQENKYYDTFRCRIMFPISDSAGRVIAFSGRTLKEDDKTPKYLNSPETKLFYKSEVLYGFNVAKNHIRKIDYTVLVEGQMDLLMSHQAGILNTVASSGTALSPLHVQKIQKLSNRVIIAYDSDSAGEKASRRAAELALSLGMETKIASLSQGEDPASVVKKDPELWKKSLRESVHFVDYALERAVSNNKGRELTKEILENVLPLISLIKSDIEKAQFVKKISLKIGVSEEIVWKDVSKIKDAEKSGTEYIKDIQTTIPNLERIMAGFVFLEESRNKGDKKLHTRLEWQKAIGNEEVTELLESYESEKEALSFEAEQHCLNGNIEKTWEVLLKRIELQNLKIRLQKTASILDDPSISTEREREIRAEFEKIQKSIREHQV